MWARNTPEENLNPKELKKMFQFVSALRLGFKIKEMCSEN